MSAKAEPAVVRAGGVIYESDEYGGWRCRVAGTGIGLWLNGSSLQLDHTAGSGVGVPPAQAQALSEVLARYARHKDLRPPTRVCSVRGLTPDEVAARGIVYVGRAHRRRDGLKRGAVLLPAHPLANPYRLPRSATAKQRAECVTMYRAWMCSDPERQAAARALRGSSLGCWCGDWDGTGEPTVECHACVIAQVADG